MAGGRQTCWCCRASVAAAARRASSWRIPLAQSAHLCLRQQPLQDADRGLQRGHCCLQWGAGRSRGAVGCRLLEPVARLRALPRSRLLRQPVAGGSVSKHASLARAHAQTRPPAELHSGAGIPFLAAPPPQRPASRPPTCSTLPRRSRPSTCSRSRWSLSAGSAPSASASAWTARLAPDPPPSPPRPALPRGPSRAWMLASSSCWRTAPRAVSAARRAAASMPFASSSVTGGQGGGREGRWCGGCGQAARTTGRQA